MVFIDEGSGSGGRGEWRRLGEGGRGCEKLEGKKLDSHVCRWRSSVAAVNVGLYYFSNKVHTLSTVHPEH